MILLKEVEVKDEAGQKMLDAITVRNGYKGFKVVDHEQTEEECTAQEFLQDMVLDYILGEYALSAKEESKEQTKQAAEAAEVAAIIDVKNELKK